MKTRAIQIFIYMQPSSQAKILTSCQQCQSHSGKYSNYNCYCSSYFVISKEPFCKCFSRKTEEIASKTIIINKTWSLQNRVLDTYLTGILYPPHSKQLHQKQASSKIQLSPKMGKVKSRQMTIVPTWKFFISAHSIVPGLQQSENVLLKTSTEVQNVLRCALVAP